MVFKKRGLDMDSQWFQVLRGLNGYLWLGLGLMGCANPAFAVWEMSTMNSQLGWQSSPAHVGVLSIRPWLDTDKTLAAVDMGGIVGTSDGIIAEFAPGHVTLMDPKKGQSVWTYAAEVPVSAPILGNRDSVFVAFADGSIVRLDRRSGVVNWKSNVPSLVTRAMTVSGGKLYFVTGAQELGALDLQTGKQEWIVDTSKSAGIQIRSAAAPLVDEGVVILGTNGGRLEGFDAKTGIRSFSSSLGSVDGRFSDIIATPLILGQLIIVARYDGLVAAFDRRSPDKAPIWKVRGAAITEAKTFAGGVYMTTAIGELISMNPKDGSILWKTKVGDSLSVLELRETSVLVSGPEGVVAQVDRSTGVLQWKEFLDSKIIQLPLYFDDALWFSTGLGNLYGYSMK